MQKCLQDKTECGGVLKGMQEIWPLKTVLVRAHKEMGDLHRKLLREYISSHEKNVGRSMDIKVHYGEISDRNEKCYSKVKKK